ncbi:MAG: hypothetical protein RQ757_00400 [Pseudomonadales bacterium]|nr:hypothetical protein [Pseudomonadales bacterium]
MKCEQASAMFEDLFAETLGSAARIELASHLHSCDSCRQQLLGLETTLSALHQWRDQAVPEWDRSLGGEIGRNAQSKNSKQNSSWLGLDIWRWSPLAMAAVLVLAVLFNVQVSVGRDGVDISLGSSTEISRLLARQREEQREETLAMLTAAMEQMSASNRDNLQQVVQYFEQQRERDMRMLEAGYQQLLDSDYQTIRSVQQLVSYVQNEQQ